MVMISPASALIIIIRRRRRKRRSRTDVSLVTPHNALMDFLLPQTTPTLPLPTTPPFLYSP